MAQNGVHMANKFDKETIEATLGLLIQYDMQWSKVSREKGVPVGTIRLWWKKIR